MTCYTVLNLSDLFQVDVKERLITVVCDVQEVIGTSAFLVPGDKLSVWEMLHGLMLPSGNDAAHMLAFHFG